MPAISSPATVLVTGTDAYVAIHVIKSLLQRGFEVRGAVRSETRGEAIKKLVGEGFEYALVPDVNQPGAFDEVVKGVDAIASVGAPLTNDAKHRDAIIRFAVDGTLGLLESAKKAETVKRVVFTSTVLAEIPLTSGLTHFTEETWNDEAVEQLKQLGPDAPSLLVYGASKVLTERAAFNYVKKHEGSVNFDVVTLLPAYVFGPPLNERNPDIEAEFSSVAALLSGLAKPSNLPAWFQPDTFVDVRDVAELHVQAITTEAASNQRFNLIGGEFGWDAAYQAFSLTRKAEPKEPAHPFTYATNKATEVFDFKFRTLEETVKDTWDEFVKRGVVTADGKANF